MTIKKVLLLLFFIQAAFYIKAQDKLNIKYGKIVPADFTITSPIVDSNCNAVVLADIGSCEFEGNNKGWFTLVFKHYKRMKILNKNGFSAATVFIHLYTDGESTEKIEDLKATTYNI